MNKCIFNVDLNAGQLFSWQLTFPQVFNAILTNNSYLTTNP